MPRVSEYMWIGDKQQIQSAVEQINQTRLLLQGNQQREPDAPVYFEATLMYEALTLFSRYLGWAQMVQEEQPNYSLLLPTSGTSGMPPEEQILTKGASPHYVSEMWNDREQFFRVLVETVETVRAVIMQLQPHPHVPRVTDLPDRTIAGADEYGHVAASRLVSQAESLTSIVEAYAAHRAQSREREEAEAQELAKRRADIEAAMAAQKKLSKKFEDEAIAETSRANYFRVLVVLTVGALAIFAGLTALGSTPQGATWETLVGHLAVSVPAFVLAGYFAREAAQHRRLARWLRVLAVQLETAEDYVRPLEESDRSTLLLALGQRVFGPLPDLTGPGSDDGDLTTALGIIERLAERR